jgi:hypothetical protein
MAQNVVENQEININEFISFAEALDNISDPSEVNVIEPEDYIFFNGFCDGHLNENETVLLKGILFSMGFSDAKLSDPLELSAQFETKNNIAVDNVEKSRVLVLSCGSTGRWKLQYKVPLNGDTEPYANFEKGNIAPHAVLITPDMDLLFLTIKDILNDNVKSIASVQKKGLPRTRLYYGPRNKHPLK